ncbi:hypothetical protein T08_11618 [Trichinella sp. T8]|nr:hypothetical protein T08_10801 [Trichinella sp. T8]KRZ67081.1 hypothetical protein T08_6996 [Trichinella sp. T8]KRZ68645.1 hypothetical protein T08_11618 [Trichinella sp. T8]
MHPRSYFDSLWPMTLSMPFLDRNNTRYESISSTGRDKDPEVSVFPIRSDPISYPIRIRLGGPMYWGFPRR